jgi:predicted phosphodiesterase
MEAVTVSRGMSVLICAAGDIHGAIERFYHDVLAFEAALGVRFDWVLHVGDFGIWPDPEKIDRGTRSHDGAGDFSNWLAAARPVPRRTVFIKGNHEDLVWLDAQKNPEVLPGLVHLRNGCKIELEGVRRETVCVGGIGGCYGPSDYGRKSTTLQGYARRHYTHDEVERLATGQGVDIVLMHDAPAGICFPCHRRGAGYVSQAAGLDVVLARARPRVCFFGHHHARVDAEVSGVSCIGLNKVRCPGNLVAVDIKSKGREWSVLGEYGAR